MRACTRRCPKAPVSNFWGFAVIQPRRDEGGRSAGSVTTPWHLAHATGEHPNTWHPSRPRWAKGGRGSRGLRVGALSSSPSRPAQPPGDAPFLWSGQTRVRRRQPNSFSPVAGFGGHVSGANQWELPVPLDAADYLCIRWLLSLQSNAKYKPRCSPDNLIKSPLLQSTCR